MKDGEKVRFLGKRSLIIVWGSSVGSGNGRKFETLEVGLSEVK